MHTKLNIAVLISGGGSNLQAIIDASKEGRLQANVLCVGSDNAAAKGLERAAKHEIPFFVVDYASLIKRAKNDPNAIQYPPDFNMRQLVNRILATRPDQNPEKIKTMIRTRIAAEIELLDRLSLYPLDLLVLAGFMRTLTPYFIDQINQTASIPKIMNIHPSLLPAFPGVDGYGDTFRYGCKVGGCTVHFVDEGEDTGPIIGQSSFNITATDDLERIKAKGLDQEWRLYPKCIQYLAEGRIRVVEKVFKLKNGRQYNRKIVEILPDEHSTSNSEH